MIDNLAYIFSNSKFFTSIYFIYKSKNYSNKFYNNRNSYSCKNSHNSSNKKSQELNFSHDFIIESNKKKSHVIYNNSEFYTESEQGGTKNEENLYIDKNAFVSKEMSPKFRNRMNVKKKDLYKYFKKDPSKNKLKNEKTYQQDSTNFNLNFKVNLDVKNPENFTKDEVIRIFKNNEKLIQNNQKLNKCY